MGRRVLGAAVAAAWILSGAVSAQVARGSAAPPGITVQRPPDPPPQSQPTAPTPLAHHHGHAGGHPPPGDLFLADVHTYAPRYDRRTHAHPPVFAQPYGYFFTGYVPAVPAITAPRDQRIRQHAPPPGFLRLQVQPLTAQVYVDGFFVGAVEDFRWSPHALAPGAHRVELQADGFGARSFEVRIRPGETVTYTRDLRRLEEPVERGGTAPVTIVAQQPPAKTIYVIPRCYAGDRPPVASQLPEGCAMAALRVIPPLTP